MFETLPRYVILHHVVAGGQHWDLMLDQGQALATWQLASDPAILAPPDAQAAIPARRIGDHRHEYLDYQGPVSRQRGHVSRVDKGTYELIQQTTAGWRVRLNGELLHGEFCVSSAAEGVEGHFHRTGG
jgi:hypothetical protein